MRRKRHRETKVWHDPRLSPAGRRRAESHEDEDEGGANGAARRRRRRRAEPTKRNGVRIVAATGPSDPRELERERLLDRVLRAEGRTSITKAAEVYVEAGFEFPRAQNVWLQLLEHSDEERVTEAIHHLSDILEEEQPQRRAVLESRLKRIEEFAEERPTQRSAGNLRRLLHTKYAETLD